MSDTSSVSPKEQLMAAIGPEVAKIDEAMRRDLQRASTGCDPLLSEILEYGLFNGGKRLRPLLVLLAARLSGFSEESGDTGALYKLAIAFEYLHAATLFHDDVIDRADMRRGKASVVKEYGEIAAILGGDFLHSRSMYLIGSLGGAAALEIFCRATNGMVDGEFLQLRNAENHNLSEDDYFSAVHGKTSLLIGATCEIGALAGGANQEEQRALAAYGMGLGTSFQIIDDLLDYQGESGSTGKAVGNDFQEGKMTLPLILALGRANPEERTRLLFLLKDEKAREGGFSEAYGFIEKNEGFVLSRKRAEAITAEALAGLDIFSQSAGASVVATLRILAEYVLVRKK
ncbi:MAG: polyprenyl synthetase family protein [Thermodesulfobacteriota bacterium]